MPYSVLVGGVLACGWRLTWAGLTFTWAFEGLLEYRAISYTAGAVACLGENLAQNLDLWRHRLERLGGQIRNRQFQIQTDRESLWLMLLPKLQLRRH